MSPACCVGSPRRCCQMAARVNGLTAGCPLDQEEALSASQLQTLLSIALEPGELGTPGWTPWSPLCVLIHDAAGSLAPGTLDSARRCLPTRGGGCGRTEATPLIGPPPFSQGGGGCSCREGTRNPLAWVHGSAPPVPSSHLALRASATGAGSEVTPGRRQYPLVSFVSCSQVPRPDPSRDWAQDL